MDTIAKDRMAAPVIMAALFFVLCFFIKPQKKELKAGAITALSISVSDYLFEILAGKLNLWHYHGGFLFLGLPLDMFVDFFFLSLCVCLGMVYFKRKGRTHVILYALALFIFLGSWGVFHNKRAIEMGFITFTKEITFGTAWFIMGNYVLLGFLVFLIMLTHEKTMKFL